MQLFVSAWRAWLGFVLCDLACHGVLVFMFCDLACLAVTCRGVLDLALCYVTWPLLFFLLLLRGLAAFV